MEPTSPVRVRGSRWPLLLHAGLVALVALRLAFATLPAVWIDEAFSLYHVKHGLAFLWTTGWRLETNPPLYYTALWAWTSAFGSAEWVARVLSVLAFAGATWFVHRAARALGGRAAGFAAAWLFACHPLVFEYSLEIRPYALLLLLVSFTVAMLARVLAALERGDDLRAAPPWRAVGCIIVGCILIAYAHATGPVILASLSGAAALYGMRSQPRAYWLMWAGANALVFIGIVPQIASTLEVLASNRQGLAWYPEPTDTEWLYVFARALFAGLYTYGVSTTKLLAACMLALLGWSAWRMRRRLDVVAIGIAIPAIGMTLLFGLSFVQPILLPRTALWVMVPASLLAGAALAGVDWHTAWARLLAVMFTALAVYMCVADIDGRTFWRPWPELILQQAARYRPGDIVVAADPETLCVLDFYAPEPLRTAPRRLLERGPNQHFRSGQRIPLGCNEGPVMDAEAITQAVAAGTGVWMMGWNDDQALDVEEVIAQIGGRAQVTDHVDMHGRPIAVRLSAP